MTELTAITARSADRTAIARPSILGKVMGLLSFAFLFTGAGAFIGAATPASVPISMLGGITTLFLLLALRETAPINLGLLYAFSIFQGMSLAPLLDRVVQDQGLGGAVAQAGLGTAAVMLTAGGYGVVTKRDLSGLGAILSLSLFALVVVTIGGLLMQTPTVTLLLGGAGAALFTGYIVYDLNAAENCQTDDNGEAILLAVNVYLDLLNLFLILLRLAADSDD